jgi:hypothetical protein
VGWPTGNGPAPPAAVPAAAAPAVTAVEELASRLGEAEILLGEFLDRFYWIKDHPDYFEQVTDFLKRGDWTFA